MNSGSSTSREGEQRRRRPATPVPRPHSATRRAVARASSGRFAAQRLPDQRLRGDRVRVEHQGQEEEQLQRDLVGAERGGAGAGGHPRGDEEGQLEHGGAQQQVAADDQLGCGAPPGRGRQAAPSRTSARTNSAGGERLPGDVGDRRADETQPDRVHEQRAEHEAEQAAGQHVPHRTAQLLHAAQPAVAGQRDQQQRRAEAGDAQPLLPRLGDGARAPGQQPGQRSGEDLEQQRGRRGRGRAPARWPARPRRRRRPGRRRRRGGRRGRSCRRRGSSAGPPPRRAARRRRRARRAATVPRCPTTAVSTSRYSGSAARTTSAGTASDRTERTAIIADAPSGRGQAP